MADSMMKIAGRDTTGKARAVKTDDKGNIGTQLQSRSELVTYGTSTVLAGKTASVVNRFDEIGNYSAIVVAITMPGANKVRMLANWYIQKPGEANGTQVTSDEIMALETVQRFATGYLEMKGTQVSIVVANASEVDVEATIYILGIR